VGEIDDGNNDDGLIVDVAVGLTVRKVGDNVGKDVGTLEYSQLHIIEL